MEYTNIRDEELSERPLVISAMVADDGNKDDDEKGKAYNSIGFMM